MSADSNSDAIRALASERRLPGTQLGRWLQMDSASRSALLELARALRLRTGQLATALDLLEEISVRDSATAHKVLQRDEIRRAIAANGSAPARARAFLEALRAVRFPRLARTTQRLRAAVAALELPYGVSIVLPKDLNSEELVIRLSARTGAELKRLLDALRDRERGLMQIVEMLAGEDEV